MKMELKDSVYFTNRQIKYTSVETLNLLRQILLRLIVQSTYIPITENNNTGSDIVTGANINL